MATADKLTTVAENVPKVYHAGQLNVIENTSTLKKSASGSAILIDDVSPVTHEMGVKVRGKNLINYQSIENVGYAVPTLIDNGFELVGTFYAAIKNISIKPNTNYYLSYITNNIVAEVKQVAVFGNNNTSNKVALFTNGVGGTFNPGNYTSILVAFYSGSSTSGTVEFTDIQLELGTTPTAYIPYVPDLTAVSVTRCGKNLFNPQLLLAATEWSVDENGVYSGKPIYLHALYNSGIPIVFKNGFTYTVSFYAKADLNDNERSLYIRFKYTDGTQDTLMVDSTEYKLYKMTSTKDISYMCFTYNNSRTTYIKDFMLELGSTTADYEPYITQTEYIPTADGTVEGVTSLYPSTTLTTDTNGVMIDCEYYKDIDVNDIVERKVTTYTNPKIKTVGYAAFQNCKTLTSVNLPNATYIDGAGFMHCELLKFVNIPSVTNINGAAFQNCNTLTSINLPSVTTMNSAVFYNCKSLITADFSAITNFTGGVFANCTALKTVIIRNNTMCTLGTTSAFSGCTLINGTGGYIYVPSSLINTYKTATNWVTYASKFRALEDYTVDGTTTGALDESKVSA